MGVITGRIFSESELRAIAQALGDTDGGLTNAEIDDLLHHCGIGDEHGPGTKWKRLYVNLWNRQVRDGHRKASLAFCRAELLDDNYFHAVLEAAKSVFDKLRALTGCADDGAGLVDKALCGNSPKLAINAMRTESERSEQTGFANLIKGTYGMFRNPAAHEARIKWTMTKEDAEDLLSLASLIHRRLDAARRLP